MKASDLRAAIEEGRQRKENEEV